MDRVKTKSDHKETKYESSRRSSEKKTSESNTRKFAVLSSQYINVIAESCGLSEVPENVLTGLAEDASYKLREIIHNCGVLLKNTKRRKLLADDVDRVCNVLDVPKLHGHLTENDPGFTFVPDADVFVVNDNEVDLAALAFTDIHLTQAKDQYVKGSWTLIEPPDQGTNESSKTLSAGKQQQDSVADPKPGPSSEVATSSSSPASKPLQRPGSKPDDPPGATRPPVELLNYYLQVAKIIISGSSPLLQVALADLRTNPNVGPVCPYLLNLVALSVNKLKRHAWLTDALLSTVQAIVENQYVDPSCYLAINRAANSLLVIAIEPNEAKNCDDLLLRTRAAQLLSKVLVTCSIEVKQQMDIVRQLLQLPLDKNISLQSQYGAIACLTSLGYRIMMYFWSVMERYFPLLDEKQKTNSPAAAHVKGAILVAAQRMYRKDLSACIPEEARRRLKIDLMLNEYFGDMLTPFRQEYSNLNSVYSTLNSVNSTDNTETSNAYKQRVTTMDYDFDYLHWNPSYLIQRNVQTTNPYLRTIRLPFDLHVVFENINYNNIGFNRKVINFDNLNQIHRKLKRKRLDEKQIYYQNSVHRLSDLWYKQNIYKHTRSIKYCTKLHTRSSSGNLFVIL